MMQTNKAVAEKEGNRSPETAAEVRDDGSEGAAEISEHDVATSATASAGGNSTPADPTRFPWKLHKMLEEIETGDVGLEDIVSWQPHGRCFIIKNKKAFTERVMPKYFYQLKYVSFQRQLNLYGFKKIYCQGPDKGAYYHEQFLRGKTELSGTIQRVKAIKGGSGGNRKSSKSEEPEIDFYAMPPLDDKAEESLEARRKFLEEEASKPTGRSKSKQGAGRKRKSGTLGSSGRDGPSDSKKAAKTAQGGSAKSSDLEPTPVHPGITSAERMLNISRQLVGQSEDSSVLPLSPLSSTLLASNLGDLSGGLFDPLTPPALRAITATKEAGSHNNDSTNAGLSEMQHIQALQQQLQQQSRHLLQQHDVMASSGTAASLPPPNLPTADQLTASLALPSLNLDNNAQSTHTTAALFGGPGTWELEPTPLKPGISLRDEDSGINQPPSSSITNLLGELPQFSLNQSSQLMMRQQQSNQLNLQQQQQSSLQQSSMQQQLLLREQLAQQQQQQQQQRQQLLPSSMTDSEQQSSVFFQQQQQLLQQLQSTLDSSDQQQDDQHDPLLFPPQGGGGSWMG